MTSTKFEKQIMKSTVIFISVSLLIQISHGEVYSSASDMKNVFQLEREMVSILGDFALKLHAKLNRINDYLQDFGAVMSERQTSSSDSEFLDKVVGNPIHAYKMMKRFAVDWKKLEQDLTDDDWKETELALKKKRLGSVMPKEEDLHGAARALIRLQDIYELDIRKLAKGQTEYNGRGFQTKARLTAQDCLFMGKHCFNAGIYSRSLEWFEEAWAVAAEEKNKTIRQDQIQPFLDTASKEHDSRVLKGERNLNLFPKPVNEEPPFKQRKKMQKTQREELEKKNKLLTYTTDMDSMRYAALCRGEDFRTPEYKSKLNCYLEDRNDPYFRLNPLRIEVLHAKPKILIYHNVTSIKERGIVQELAGPLLMRSQVLGSNHGSSEVSQVRTSKTGWLQDSFDPVIEHMSQKVSWMTGLNTNTWKDEAELLQIANYVNAGHYSSHHDYIMKDKDPNHMIFLGDTGIFLGDRIATWMYYLNDVPAGGRTVFPRLGVGTEPIAGAAVFWYNLHESGDPDQDTLHGACPMLQGTKWVSNKWIREGAQLFARPCKLTRK